MKGFFVFILFFASTHVRSQSISDTVKIFHDKERYLKCLTNGEFYASFLRSDLEIISTVDKRVKFDAKQKIFEIKDNNNLSGSGYDISLALKKEGPIISYLGETYNLDSVDSSLLTANLNSDLNKGVGSLNFIVKYREGKLYQIVFGIRTGWVFEINVDAYHAPRQYSYLAIRCRRTFFDNDFNYGFSLEYTDDLETPFSIAMLNGSHVSIYLGAYGKRKKYESLSVSRYYTGRPLQNYYRINYSRQGKAKGHENVDVSEDNCENCDCR